MNKKKAENQSDIRIFNQRLILNEIIQKGGASRADLAKAIKLSAPSVSANVEPLIERNILIETTRQHSTTGRKPIYLEFNGNYGYVIGVDLSKGRVSMALGNLCGTILQKKEGAYTGKRVGMDLINFVEKHIREFLEEGHIAPERVMAISIASPGILTNGEHVRIEREKLNWNNLDVHDILNRRFNIKVIVENDINIAALGEFWALRKHEELNSFVFVSVGRGLGAGIIINQQLFKGAYGGAGELAFMKMINRDGCPDGLAETFVSTQIIKKHLVDRKVLSPKAEDNQVFHKAAQLLRNKDKEMLDLMEEISYYLGIIIGNLVAVINPQKVIIGGELMALNEYILPRMEEMVKQAYPFPIDIEMSGLREEVGLIGCIEIARKDAIEQLIH